MTHLGERVVDLVDGQLSPADAERANAHLAACRACRDHVEAERLTKARLAALGSPEPSDDLFGRLLAIAAETTSRTAPAEPGVVPAVASTSVTSEVLREPALADGVTSVPDVVPDVAQSAVAARTRTVAVGGSRSGAPTGATPAGSPLGRRPGGVPAAAAAATRPGSPAAARPGSARPTRRGVGRAIGRRAGRGRLAAAVIGALGTVGAGVAALAVAAPAAPASVVPFDSFVVQSVATTVRLPILDIPGGWQLLRHGSDGSREGSRTTR